MVLSWFAPEQADFPADRETVLTAARLGWALAEVRGRVREIAAGSESPPARPTGVLPVGQERSLDEQLIEYFTVIAALATTLKVDVPASSLSHAPADVGDDRASKRFRKVAWAVANAKPGDPAIPSLTQDLATLSYAWDARIQDELASAPPVSAAYQLGRSVGEIRWTLDAGPTDPDGATTAGFLLGPERGGQIDRLIDRVTAYYDPVTRHGLKQSLSAWRISADSPIDPSVPEWRAALKDQATIWHDLILGRRDGASYISPKDVIDHPISLVAVARKLKLETLLLGVGVLLLFGAAFWLASSSGDELVAAVVAALGISGVTAGGLAARARTQASDLLGALRRDLYRGLVAERVTVRPSSTAQPPSGAQARPSSRRTGQ